MSLWSSIFRGLTSAPQPPTWPRQQLYTVALSERVGDLTDHWRGQHLMRIAATSSEEARERALAKAKRVGINLTEQDIIDVTGGDRDA